MNGPSAQRPTHHGGVFRQFAHAAAEALGSPWAFIGALASVVLWAALGPLFRYSDAWQLVINTGTTIMTFLMVFLIQNAQNRDALAIHLKLDELLRAVHEARTGLVSLEDCSDEDLSRLRMEFAALAKPDASLATPQRPTTDRS